MGLRGPKPKPREQILWSPEIAYAVGLIATDGCLYNNGRHINFTSKDFELINTFKKCLGINNKISTKYSGFNRKSQCHFIQFGNVSFYQFLIDVGLTPAKSKTMGALVVPDQLLPDLLRGLYDGDGSFYSYHDPRWPRSFLFYLSFTSASKDHLVWLRDNIQRILDIKGHGIYTPSSGAYQLKYAKREARKIIDFMYYRPNVPCLERKRKKIYNTLTISAGVGNMRT